jgi:hypothetical protein
MYDVLIQQALQKFGDKRTEELKPDIEKLAADLQAIHEHPLTIEDEL